jgi:hypothetical protein
MEADDLRNLVARQPFHPFTIHMNDGSRLRVAQPDDFIMHRDWVDEAIVVLPKGKWTFIYLPNVAHVSTQGKWPKVNGRHGRRSPGGGE